MSETGKKSQREKIHRSSEKVLRHLLSVMEQKIATNDVVGLSPDEERAMRAVLTAYRLSGKDSLTKEDSGTEKLETVSAEELEKLLSGG
jgi:hypothetical protein